MLEVSIGTSFHSRKGPNGMPVMINNKKNRVLLEVYGGWGGGLREEHQSNEQCRHFPFFFFFSFFFLRLRLRYILLIKFMRLLVEMCELLVNLRCFVTKVINK